MNRSNTIACAAFVFASLAVAGCASRKPVVHSTADPSYAKTIHKLYVVAELPRNARVEFITLKGRPLAISRTDAEGRAKLYQTYAVAVEAEFKNIGIEAECEVRTDLELDESAVDKRIAAYDPDACLTIDCVDLALLPNGGYLGASYDASLLDYPSGKRVWRGKFTLANMNAVFADVLAKQQCSVIVWKLQDDQMQNLGTIEQ